MSAQQLSSKNPSPKQFSQERLMKILVAPQISEKATYVAEKNEQVVFRVAMDATKPEIKAAIEMMFKVNVSGVQVACVKGKVKRVGRIIGRRNDWKKAYVSLAAGQEINFAANEQG
jgi:large subunit ribosomal protein L23